MFIEKLEQVFNKLEKKLQEKELIKIYLFVTEIISMNKYNYVPNDKQKLPEFFNKKECIKLNYVLYRLLNGSFIINQIKQNNILDLLQRFINDNHKDINFKQLNLFL